MSITSCDDYLWNGVLYDTSGVYTWRGINSKGCDSIASLNLTINYSSSFVQNQIACDSFTWSVDGLTYYSSGTYVNISTNSDGCTQIDTLELVVNSSSTSTSVHTACDNYLWNGELYDSSGVYSWTGTNTIGCDSIAYLYLTVNKSTIANFNIQI